MSSGQSRRRFLQTSAGLGLIAGLPRSLAADSAVPVPAPGLLFGPGDIPRICATLGRPQFAAFWKAARETGPAADERFLRDQIRLSNRVSDLARAGQILVRSSFVHAVEPDAGQLRLARLALSRVMEYPRWDWILDRGGRTVGVMRAPTTCVAAILAYDWLGADLGAAERAAIERRIGEDAGPACRRAVLGENSHDFAAGWTVDPDEKGLGPLDVSRWPEILDGTNLRIIATAGLTAAGCLLRGRHPEAEAWCDEGEASLRLFASRLPSDASFPEQVGYWSFTFTFYCLALEMLRRSRGTDMRGVLDFPAMARFALASAAPTVGRTIDCINIGDCSGFASPPPLAWIGREFRDGTSQHLLARPDAIHADEATSCLAAIWFDPGVPPRIAADAPLDRQAAPGLVISRSGWALDDSIVCLRSGGPSNHEHADRNSVIFMAHGERLLTDPLHASYSRSDPKWLLRLTEAHTAVLIDGRGHVYFDDLAGTHSSTASATLLDHRVGPDWMCATSDAADAYRRAGLPAVRVLRTIVFLKPEILIFLDQVTLDRPASVQARFQAYNDDGNGSVAATGGAFVISRPGSSLRARVASRLPVTVSAGRLGLPSSGGVYPFAEVASDQSPSHSILTVCTAAPAGSDHGPLLLEADPVGWHVRGSHRGRAVAVRIAESADGGAPSVIF